jgi:hypothetical protein
LLYALNPLNNLKRDEFFKSWLIRILINECYGILRKRSKITNLSETTIADVDEVDLNEKIDISNALKSLSYELRVVVEEINNTVVDEYTYRTEFYIREYKGVLNELTIIPYKQATISKELRKFEDDNEIYNLKTKTPLR